MKHSLFVFLLLVAGTNTALAFPWVVSPGRARLELSKGALLLDARSASAWKKGHLKGAQSTPWQLFARRKKSQRGLLASSLRTLKTRLQKVGVSSHRVILVVADAKYGWGEDGRTVWMLRVLGHNKAALVDGGVDALRKLGHPWTKNASKVSPGTFRPRWLPRWRASRHQVKQWLRSKVTKFVDTRERREYRGQTPYGESRGGHLPNAIHLHFKELQKRNGRLKSRRTLLKLLRKKGLTKKKRIVSYCTGGIRSAWVVVVLHRLGYRNVLNYDGSMWEWASYPSNTHPLISSKSPSKK